MILQRYEALKESDGDAKIETAIDTEDCGWDHDPKTSTLVSLRGLYGWHYDANPDMEISNSFT